MGAHSLNSPSSFARRIGCPGSANAERNLPNTTSIYAAEGTAAHALGEKCLLNDVTPDYYKGEMIETEMQNFEVDAEMIEAVRVYVDHCAPMINGKHLVEKKLDLPFLGPEEKGTADFISIHDRDLHVVDYKHGKGVPVDAIGNVQGLCYGLGASLLFKQETWCNLVITIVQPRAYHDDGPIRTWKVSRGELIDYMIEFAATSIQTEDPNAPRIAGSHCRFCKAKAQCPTNMQLVEETLRMDFSDPDSKPVDPQNLTDEEILDIVFNKVKIIEQWCQSLKDYAQKKAEVGEPIPGSKLVATRAKRIFKDPAMAEQVLFQRFGEDVYEKKFVSAPKMEKIIGKKEFAEFDYLVDKISTGVTLVPESDPRQSARPTGEDEFGSVF